MFDRETNRNKGFGFVTFEDDEGVERAMGATGQELDGKPVSRSRRAHFATALTIWLLIDRGEEGSAQASARSGRY